MTGVGAVVDGDDVVVVVDVLGAEGVEFDACGTGTAGEGGATVRAGAGAVGLATATDGMRGEMGERCCCCCCCCCF